MMMKFVYSVETASKYWGLNHQEVKLLQNSQITQPWWTAGHKSYVFFINLWRFFDNWPCQTLLAALDWSFSSGLLKKKIWSQHKVNFLLKKKIWSQHKVNFLEEDPFEWDF